MQFFFLGGRLAVDLLNTVIAQDGRVRDLLSRREDVASWSEAAGVVSRRDLRNASHEPAELRAFRDALRHGLVAWAAAGTPPARLIALLNHHLARDPAARHEAIGACAAGSHIVNVLPARGAESTVMCPPCSSARSRAIARPRPVPPRSLLRD